MRRLIISATVVTVIGMCLYPPWLRTRNFVSGTVTANSFTKIPLPSQYAFLLTPPEKQNITASIDIRRLSVQCAIVLLAGGGLAFLCRSKDKKSQ